MIALFLSGRLDRFGLHAFMVGRISHYAFASALALAAASIIRLTLALAIKAASPRRSASLVAVNPDLVTVTDTEPLSQPGEPLWLPKPTTSAVSSSHRKAAICSPRALIAM